MDWILENIGEALLTLFSLYGSGIMFMFKQSF